MMPKRYHHKRPSDPSHTAQADGMCTPDDVAAGRRSVMEIAERNGSRMPRRELGRGLRVSAIGFGAMGMSEFYGPAGTEEDSLRLLDQAFALGVSMFDTADMYGSGHNEELLGRFLASRKSEVSAGKLCVTTKFGIERDSSTSYNRRINNSVKYIRKSCEQSLRRLQVERIDLYYVHRLEPAADLAETMGCLGELVKEGKVAHVGLCEVSAATLRRAHRLHPITALQSEYSLWTRELEDEVLPAARALGVGIVAYSPLGRGFLTGRLRSLEALAENDFRRSNPRFVEENLRRNLHLLRSLESTAKRYECTTAQVALAWLLAQDPHIVPIPGTRRLPYLRENIGAVEVRLSASDLAELSRACSSEHVFGQRYTPEGMKGVGL
jgi:aryl-alcohol dehydrogenase-like predicted oxidoreductase